MDDGVAFIEENGGGPGVRSRKQPAGVVELTEQIKAIDEKIAKIDVTGERSPETGMNQLRRALVRNEQTNLKNRRVKIGNKEPK